MKLKPEFDVEFPPKPRRRWWPFRSIGSLMLLVLAIALGLAIMAERASRQQAIANRALPRLRTKSAVWQVPPREQQAKPPVIPLRDRFVITADASIDAKMVVPAPEGIDDAMVFNPDVRARLPKAIAPRLAVPSAPPPR
jgi:hypothetical protein